MRLVAVKIHLDQPKADWREILRRETGIHIPEEHEFKSQQNLVITPDQFVDLMKIQWRIGGLIRVLKVDWETTNRRVGVRKWARNLLLMLAQKA